MHKKISLISGVVVYWVPLRPGSGSEPLLGVLFERVDLDHSGLYKAVNPR